MTAGGDIVVDAAALRAVLKRLHKLGGKTPGPGIWRARDGVLEVEWKGGTEGVDASGALGCSLRIAAEHMVVLARTLTDTGTLRISSGLTGASPSAPTTSRTSGCPTTSGLTCSRCRRRSTMC